jgi:hypothetical protein
MKKILIGAMAALAAGGSLAAPPAMAQPNEWHGGYQHHDHDAGAALAAGIAGLAIGAALASDHDGYYAPPAYVYGAPAYYGGPAYYAGPSYYGYYGRCHAVWRWSPYWGRHVRVRACD